MADVEIELMDVIKAHALGGIITEDNFFYAEVPIGTDLPYCVFQFPTIDEDFHAGEEAKIVDVDFTIWASMRAQMNSYLLAFDAKFKLNVELDMSAGEWNFTSMIPLAAQGVTKDGTLLKKYEARRIRCYRAR